MADKITLVGHRGEPASFPENSLESFTHALMAGAAYIETDINITADGVAVLSHDENLNKMTGSHISITQNTYRVFKDIPAGYPERFSDRYKHCRIATLMQLSALLECWPKTTCFVELKEESLSCFGNQVVDLVVASLQTITAQTVLISFDYAALVYAREQYNFPIGWVLPEWTVENKIKAEKLSADYLFVDKAFCPENKNGIWPGPWQWVVYTVNTPAEIKQYADLGITIIETDCISELQQALAASAHDDDFPQ
jgi:glycerophosphoryl diester phosphodiesterase